MNHTVNQKSYATIYRPENGIAHCCINFKDEFNSSVSGTMVIIDLKNRCRKLGITKILDISNCTKFFHLNPDKIIKNNGKIITFK